MHGSIPIAATSRMYLSQGRMVVVVEGNKGGTVINLRHGDDRNRTDDLMRAKHIFYHLNYTPSVP